MLGGALLVALAACAPAGRPIVAEVFYDATGDDTGLEFVELYNPAGVPASLAGVRLEAGDGAGPGRWSLRWTGGAADSVHAFGRFVVGGARVTPAPQAVVELGLQNGPDAIRLVWPDGDVEVVGYGVLGFPEYFCGTPAPDVASGLSLARVPDDADHGSNALDFRPAVPSPGAANQPGRDLAIVAGSLSLVPEQPAAGAGASLAGVVVDRGSAIVSPGEAELTLRSGGEVLAAAPFARSLAPGDTASFLLGLPGLPAGKVSLVARVGLPGDEAPGNDADSLLARIGPGPLVVTEIQFHPPAGEGEWVEVRANGPADPAAFTLSDRGATRGVPAAGGGPLEPDSLAILAQDRAAFLARHPGLDARRVWQVSPWASLNNTDDSTGFADAVVLRERDGTRSDRVDYTSAGIPSTVPIELTPWGTWEACSDPAGTPLSPPHPRPVLRARFDLEPRRLPAGTSLNLAWSLPWPVGRVAIDVYDLLGRRVAQALPESEVGGRGGKRWTPGAVPPGVYVVALRAWDRTRAQSLVETRPLRIEGRTP